MRRPYVAAALAALMLTVFGVAGVALSACGSSTTSTAAGQTGAVKSGSASNIGARLTQILDTLVGKGTITSAQEKLVVAALTKSMGGGRPSGTLQSPGAQPAGTQPSPGAQPPSGAQPSSGAKGAGPSSMFSTALSALVSKGTITSAQKAAIAKALSSGMQSGPSGQQAPGSSSQSL
jgi:hypothetical protein